MPRPLSKIAFAGNRAIAVRVLRHLVNAGVQPEALLVASGSRASHDGELAALCSTLPAERILRGTAFRSPAGVELLASLGLDAIIAVHFPYVLPRDVLNAPAVGVLNLHPAYLPFKRGWNTPSWAILDGSPAGATLHFMDEGIDTGDIVHRRTLAVSPGDTADSLYKRVLDLEFEVFVQAWPSLATGDYVRIPQAVGAGSSHARADLFADTVRRIDLDRPTTARDVLRRLRALSTSRPDEAAFFVDQGLRYSIRVEINEIQPDD
jgi:methionyl-tRNA formyltransferase